MDNMILALLKYTKTMDNIGALGNHRRLDKATATIVAQVIYCCSIVPSVDQRNLCQLCSSFKA